MNKGGRVAKLAPHQKINEGEETMDVVFKDYIVLKAQGVFIDRESGVNLNLFSLDRAYCKTPEAVKKDPTKFRSLSTALRLGHIITTKEPPVEGPRRSSKDLKSPLAEILNLDFSTFKSRIGAMKSIDALEQVQAIEEARPKENGGPRNQFVGVLSARISELYNALEDTNKKAYDDNQDPAAAGVVARQDIRKANKPTAKRRTRD